MCRKPLIHMQEGSVCSKPLVRMCKQHCFKIVPHLNNVPLLSQIVTQYNTLLTQPPYKTAARHESKMKSFPFLKWRDQDWFPLGRVEILIMINMTIKRYW